VFQPFWQDNPAYTITIVEMGGGAVISETNDVADFNYDFQVAPRAWLGYTGSSGFGVRGRYWSFETDSEERPVNPTGVAGTTTVILSSAGLDGTSLQTNVANDILTVGQSLNIYIVDLEMTQEFSCSSWVILLAGGIRYGSFQQDYAASVVSGTTMLATFAEDHTQEFQGVGPTLAYELRRPLMESVALYHSGRGAFLFGTHEEQFSIMNLANVGLPVFSDSRNEQRFVPMGEFELGGEYSTDLGGLRLLVRASVVGIVRTDYALGGASLTASLQR
jgi:hypothetical protein